MREVFLIFGLVTLAIAFRSVRIRFLRKVGALTMLAASFLLFHFITDSYTWGAIGVSLWFFLPWIELLTRIRSMRLPSNNRLASRSIPDSNLFPNAPEATEAMEDIGFDHISDCGWEWDGMRQFFRIFWHPEERAIASVCLCEQSHVVFAFITISSSDANGHVWRTTNFPFSPSLQNLPHVHWNKLPCNCNCFSQILHRHHQFLSKNSIVIHDLRMPDPDEAVLQIESEMRNQLTYNQKVGIITPDSADNFRYTTRGLFFLWLQYVKDMIRFC